MNIESIDIETVKNVLDQDDRVLFAYIYGSFSRSDNPIDLDIAVFSVDECDDYILSADLKIQLSE